MPVRNDRDIVYMLIYYIDRMEENMWLERCGMSAEPGRSDFRLFKRTLVRKPWYFGEEGIPIYVPETDANLLKKSYG